MSVDIRPELSIVHQCETVYEGFRVEVLRLNNHRSGCVNIAPPISNQYRCQALGETKRPVEAHWYANMAFRVNEPSFGITLIDRCKPIGKDSETLELGSEIPASSSYGDAPVGGDVAASLGSAHRCESFMKGFY